MRPLIENPDVVAAIEALLEEAPPLTPEQKDRLRSLLTPSMREPVEHQADAA